ncbi:hypothetical protein EKPJFOCH_2059 [Methylobacterium thuringiense]|uniref:Methyltransferase type 11 domain-containing protein n=2 Tax=Methylobacterium thuringiense TaxID=1003091 RepID=A0ABQ4TPI0_9HYPH|nr:hypothetical protein EKPJFOCH_2059 [Methylobacterium thuringiense]
MGSKMKPSDLPCLGVISNWDGHYLRRYANLEGKKVLCLGYSEGQIDEFVAPLKPSEIHILTLWEDHIDAHAGKYPVTIGDITKRTNFADESFDAVVSLSLLEHVAPLEDAFLEMKRVTRSGGENFHMFGPAWSCAYGSHLFTNSDDPMLAFSHWQMPAFMHLLCSQREIRDFYNDRGYHPAVGNDVVEEVFFKKHINRVFYDHYIRLMSTHFRIENSELMTVDVPSDLLQTLRKRYPGAVDFSTYGGKYHLKL